MYALDSDGIIVYAWEAGGADGWYGRVRSFPPPLLVVIPPEAIDDNGGKAFCDLDSSIDEIGEYTLEAEVPAPLLDRFEDLLEDDIDDLGSLSTRDAGR